MRTRIITEGQLTKTQDVLLVKGGHNGRLAFVQLHPQRVRHIDVVHKTRSSVMLDDGGWKHDLHLGRTLSLHLVWRWQLLDRPPGLQRFELPALLSALRVLHHLPMLNPLVVLLAVHHFSVTNH